MCKIVSDKLDWLENLEVWGLAGPFDINTNFSNNIVHYANWIKNHEYIYKNENNSTIAYKV